MYQQPATATRSTARPVTAPPRPKWQLAGRQVQQAMYYDADKAKKSGYRVSLLLLTLYEGSTETPPDECQNCLSAGYLGLDTFLRGPFQDMPQSKQGSADEVPTVHLRPAWHNGAWWQVAREMYLCPLCNSDREIQL
jgi:hypothetical protein